MSSEWASAADLDRLLPLAQAHELGVIEDAAQAIGAELNGNKLSDSEKERIRKGLPGTKVVF